jgi:hypothetical protein
MPHASLKLVPGVNTTKSPALNEAGISASNLIRFLPDKDGALPQKLNGWVKYYQNKFSSPIRALKAWEDLNANTWLGIGTETSLSVLNNGQQQVITPQTGSSSITPWNSGSTASNISMTVGSSTVTITDSGSNANVFSFVYFSVPVSVGGVILNGAYPVASQISASQYTIAATSVAAFSTAQTVTMTIASPAVFTVTNAPQTGTAVVFSTTGSLPTGITAGVTYYVKNINATTFNISAAPGGANINTSGTQSGTHTANFVPQTRYLTSTNASSVVDVIFPYSNAAVNDNVVFSVTDTVGGIIVKGLYTVYTALAANEFNFVSASSASSSASVFDNSGNISVTYYYSPSPSSGATAFGAGAYGSGPFGGTSSPGTTGTPITASDWFLDNWGQVLIANPTGGALYSWQPNGVLPTAQYIQNAPLFNTGAFVAMPQRQIVAWGSSFSSATDYAGSYSSIIDPLLIRWCDIENYNVWTASSVNQAGSFRIPTGSKIVGAMQGPQQGLFWTDLDLWSMQYIGAPLVYGFNKIDSNCGLIAPKAAGQLHNSIFWMSQNQFFMMAGSGVQPITCPVWDVIFQNLDRNNLSKIRCGTNTSFNEVWWFYPSTSGNGEIDSYVKLNVVLNLWDYGSLGRTAWIDQSVLGTPIGAGTDNYLYQHEQGYSAAGGPLNASFTTGYFAVEDANNMIFMDQVWPDMKWGPYNGAQNATIYITINTVNYPTDTPVSYGPYAMTSGIPYINIRARGRLFSFTIQSTDGAETFWRLERIRYRYAPDGKF